MVEQWPRAEVMKARRLESHNFSVRSEPPVARRPDEADEAEATDAGGQAAGGLDGLGFHGGMPGR